MISFVVRAIPQAKARPRFFVSRKTGRIGSYTPKKTVAFEGAIKRAYLEAGGKVPQFGTNPIRLEIIAYLPRAKSNRMKFCTIKPDWDNIGKAVADALNGLAYCDDKQIISGSVTKAFADYIAPNLKITITQIGE